MKVIDGKGAILGRLASYVAKEALRGEDIAVVNCEEIIITGNRKSIEKNFIDKRQRVGSTQKGPKVSRLPHLIVKRVIRGMLPNYREGRGRVAFKKIKCYPRVPEEFKDSKKIVSGKTHKSKFILVKEIPR